MHISRYELNCGCVLRFEQGDNRVVLEREHGVYHVKGFAPDHFWNSYHLLKDARKFFRTMVRQIKGLK